MTISLVDQSPDGFDEEASRMPLIIAAGIKLQQRQ